MAPNLANSQHVMIQGMIEEGTLTNGDMAEVARCSERTISTSRTNHRLFGSTKTPYNGCGGRPRSMTPQMMEALLNLLREDPTCNWKRWPFSSGDTFDELLSPSTISRA